MVFDLVVRGGRVVSPGGVAPMDVAVRDGRIAALARPGEITEEAAQVIEADGQIVLPGGVEPHAHFNARVPEVRTGRPDVHTQQPLAGSMAAAFGGTTTFVDFALPAPMPGESVPVPNIEADVDQRRREYSGNCYTDFAFHCTLFGDVLPGDRGVLVGMSTLSYTDEFQAAGRPKPQTPLTMAPEFWRWDARASWTNAGEDWNVSAFVNNIMDDVGVRNQFDYAEIEGSRRVVEPTNPRMYGLEVQYKFGAFR